MPAEAADTGWWIGFIWAAALGWAMSSYASSIICRLPRGEYLFDRKPYCDACEAPLKPIDLAPILSYLLTAGKCRYCGAGVPFSYFLIELVFLAIFLAGYYFYGFSDLLLLIAWAAMLLVALAMLAHEHDYFSPPLLAWIAVPGALAKTLVYGSVLNAAMAGFYGLFAGCVVAALMGQKAQLTDLRTMPAYVWLLMAAGIWLPLTALPVFAGVWVSVSLAYGLWQRHKPRRSVYLLGFAPALLAAIFYTY